MSVKEERDRVVHSLGSLVSLGTAPWGQRFGGTREGRVRVQTEGDPGLGGKVRLGKH